LYFSTIYTYKEI